MPAPAESSREVNRPASGKPAEASRTGSTGAAPPKARPAALPKTQPAAPPKAQPAVPEKPDPELAELAAQLGSVYASMPQPMGPNDIPPKDARSRPPTANLKEGIRVAYPADRYLPNTLVPQQGWSEYCNAYWTVIPRFEREAVWTIANAMDRQVGELIKLGRRLGAANMPQRLCDIGRRIGKRVGGFMPGPTDEAYALQFGSKRVGEVVDTNYEHALQSSFSKRFWDAVAAELSAPDALDPRELGRQEARDLLRVLSLHPSFKSLIISYAIGPDRGNADAQIIIQGAIAASAEFKVDMLVHPDHIWRYPPVISLAIDQMGLSNVYGFPEWIAELGGVKRRNPVDTVLMTIGFAIMLVSVFLTGPIAIAGLGAEYALSGYVAVAALAGADFGIASWQAGVTYLREREQDVAATGSTFSARKLAERPDYSASVMAGAAALLSGIAFVFAGVRLAARLKNPAGDLAVPPRTSNDPAASRLKAIEGNGVTRGEVIERRTFRPRWQERTPPPSPPPARKVSGGRPIAEPLPDAVSRGKPIVQRRIDPDAPVASGSGGGSKPPPSSGAPPAGTGSAGAGAASKGQSGAPAAKDRGTGPESKGTGGPKINDRLSSTKRMAGSQEYSMIKTEGEARLVANPKDLNEKIKVAPFTDRPRRGGGFAPLRPVGKMDRALVAVARDVRAQVAGVGTQDFFKNVAVARVRVGPNGPVRYIAVVNTPADVLGDISRGLDSEQVLLHYVEGRNDEGVNFILEALYTERAPCYTCEGMLAKQPYSEIPIFYSVVDETRSLRRAEALRTAWGL